MKSALISIVVGGVGIVYLLVGIGARRHGRAWVPFTTGADARLRVSREENPAGFWTLVVAQFAIAVGVGCLLVRVLAHA